MNLLRRIRAFVIRDFQLALSYRVEFFIRLVWILGIVTTFYFISRIFASNFVNAEYEQWQNPLVAWLTGMAMLNYFMVGFSALANAIRQEQMQGTLESVLLTPINVPTVIISSSAWSYVEATFNSFLYLFFGWLFFNVQYKGNFLLALLFLVLTTMCLACLGILSASFAMVFKRGDPFAILLGAGTALFSGVFFPEGNAAGIVRQNGRAHRCRDQSFDARTRRNPQRFDSRQNFFGSSNTSDNSARFSRRSASFFALDFFPRHQTRQTRRQFDSILIKNHEN